MYHLQFDVKVYFGHPVYSLQLKISILGTPCVSTAVFVEKIYLGHPVYPLQFDGKVYLGHPVYPLLFDRKGIFGTPCISSAV